MDKRLPENQPTAASSPVTIHDIAQAAGVHAASVSRALRGSRKVSEDTRQKILKIADEMGYRPNAIASALRTRQTHLVGIVVPDLANPLFGPIVQGLEQELRRQGLMCLMVQTPQEAAERRDIVAALANRQVAGLAVFAAESDDPMLDAALQLHIPTVLVNRGLGERRFDSVVNDDRDSARLVLEHLHGLGHGCIAHLAGPRSSSTGRARREAFEELCQRQGLTAVVAEAAAFTREAGREAAVRLLQQPRQWTALFGGNDLIALGALDALRQHGLRVPDDVSLVGHNDMPLVDLVSPPLTTVRVDVAQMSRDAAQLLLQKIAQPQVRQSTRVLAPELVVRQSTGPRRA